MAYIIRSYTNDGVLGVLGGLEVIRTLNDLDIRTKHPIVVTNYQTTVCNPCHGATNGVTTGDDREPKWSEATSVDCQTCHVGVAAQINNGFGLKTAELKNAA